VLSHDAVHALRSMLMFMGVVHGVAIGVGIGVVANIAARIRIGMLSHARPSLALALMSTNDHVLLLKLDYTPRHYILIIIIIQPPSIHIVRTLAGRRTGEFRWSVHDAATVRGL